MWIGSALRIPFNKWTPLAINNKSSPEQINEFLGNALQKMNDVFEGHAVAKEEILDYIARIVSNPNTSGNVLAVQGRLGTKEFFCFKKRLTRYYRWKRYRKDETYQEGYFRSTRKTDVYYQFRRNE
jgi:hypothetical protein